MDQSCPNSPPPPLPPRTEEEKKPDPAALKEDDKEPYHAYYYHHYPYHHSPVRRSGDTTIQRVGSIKSAEHRENIRPHHRRHPDRRGHRSVPSSSRSRYLDTAHGHGRLQGSRQGGVLSSGGDDGEPPEPVGCEKMLMATAFDVGNDDDKAGADGGGGEPKNHGHGSHHGRDGYPPPPPPPHLLGLFHRRQVGAARTQTLRVPRLSSLSTTTVELAEMGVKLTPSKTNKFGDMSMEKRRPWHKCGGLSGGKLSLAPLFLNKLTACWLINMAAFEACLGATQADNFAVSSYVCALSCLANREEDVKELRGKGIINSALCDMGTLQFFKWTAPDLRVGHRYYEVFQALQEYRKERWVWIAVHSFLYRNYKTMVAVLSIAGVLAGLFKNHSLAQATPVASNRETCTCTARWIRYSGHDRRLHCISPLNSITTEM